MTRLDGIGVFLSAACAVHCAAAPLLAASLPLVASQESEVVASVALTAFALAVVLAGVRRHRRLAPLAPLAAGLGALALARRWEGAEGSPLGHALVLTSSGLLIAAHLLNRRALRASGAACCEPAPADPRRI